MASLYSLLHPAGASATGVAALRLAVALFVLALLDASPFRDSSIAWLAWLGALAVAAGVLTRLLALLVVVGSVLLWRQSGGAAAAFVAVGGLAALALALIGAGALSVDAHLFGRRVIELGE